MTKPRFSLLDDDRLRGLIAALASIAIHAILFGLLSLRLSSFEVEGAAEAPIISVNLQEDDAGEPATAVPVASAKLYAAQASNVVASPMTRPPQEAAKVSDGPPLAPADRPNSVLPNAADSDHTAGQSDEPSPGGATATGTGSGLLDHAALELASSVFPQDNRARRELEFVLAVKYSLED